MGKIWTDLDPVYGAYSVASALHRLGAGRSNGSCTLAAQGSRLKNAPMDAPRTVTPAKTPYHMACCAQVSILGRKCRFG